MLDSIFEGIKSFLGDTLTSVLEAVLNATLFKLMYYIEIGMCWIIDQLYTMFRVFAGIDRVSYDGKPDYLINVFFSNGTVSNIYWAMALIGIALTFGFLIWAVARKMFDLDGRQQTSMGQIVGAGMKSILLIVSMTLVISVVLRMTNTLMEQITELFDEGNHLSYPVEREFTEEEYAAMGRVLSVIGNASMVPTSDNRYNVNLCYNEIRGDMLYLQTKGVFMYSYYQTDKNGNEMKSWQSVLARIAHSTDLRYDVKIDVYNQGVMESITEAMNYLQSGGTITPVSHVSDTYKSDGNAHLDRMVFLMGTLRAARNGAYNQSPSLTDALRAPYYYEQGRSIYNFDDVDDDFNIGFPTDYIVVFIAGVAAIVDLLTIILNCVARIFNMLFLYIIAPPVIAAAPLDGGGKFKQWTTAFIVQSLSVFGTVIAMRLLMIYLPIVISPQLVLFPDKPLLDALAKFLLIFGGFEAAKKSTSLLTGILADSAGWQAVQAGDMSGSAGRMLGGITGAAKGAAGLALKTAGGVANFATKPVQNLGKRAWAATGGKWENLGNPSEKSKAMAEAKHGMAVDDARQQLLAERGGGGGGGDSPALPDSQSSTDTGGDSSALPESQSSTNNGGDSAPSVPQAPPPPPRPGSPETQVAAKASAMHSAMAGKVDAQGNMKSASGGGEQTSRKLGGGFTSQGNREVGGIGNRPTLGDKPSTPPAPRSKEAPMPRSRPTMAQMERRADFRAATTSSHTSVGGSVSSGGSYTVDSGGSRTSFKSTPTEAPSRAKEAPTPSSRRISLDD